MRGESNNLERFREIRKVVDNVQKELPPEQKTDSGEIRMRVARKMMETDKNKPEEEKLEIAQRAITRYFGEEGKEWKIGSPEVHGHIDAIHTVPPTVGEIASALESNFPELAYKRRIYFAEEYIRRKTEFGEQYFLQGLEDPHEIEVLKKAAEIQRKYDMRTGNIVKEAAISADATFITPRLSRVTADLNRPSENRETRGIKTLEYGFNARLVYQELLKKSIKNSVGLTKNGEAEKPYLQISVHGAAKLPNSEFCIGLGMIDKKLPCNEKVAEWFKRKAEGKISQKKILNKDNELAQVTIDKEGPYRGPRGNIDYRYGDNDKIEGFGNNYQAIQLESSAHVRKNYQREISEILAEILKEFSQEFPNKESLE